MHDGGRNSMCLSCSLEFLSYEISGVVVSFIISTISIQSTTRKSSFQILNIVTCMGQCIFGKNAIANGPKLSPDWA